MNINQIEPKFKELEEGVDGAMSQIGDLEKRLEQLAAGLQDHESASVYDAHAYCPSEPGSPEPVNELPTEEVPDDSDDLSPNGEASQPEPESPEPTEESEDEDARFRSEEAPEKKAEPVATVEVVVSGDLDVGTAALLEQLKFVDTNRVKVTVDRI